MEPDVIDAYNSARKYTAFYKGKSLREIESIKENGIALLGNSGCGKTHLLISVSNNLLEWNHEVIYFPWVEGMEEFRAASFEEKDQIIHRMQVCGVLFLDDLFKGGEKPTNQEFKFAWAVLNYRYLNQKPIMISSERTITDMLDIDEAMGSRIAEVTKPYRVTVKGERKKLNYRIRGEE